MDRNTAYPDAARSSSIFSGNYRELEEVEKWLLNYARNANKPIPVESAITTKKPNAPRRGPSMRVPNLLRCHHKRKKIEVQYDLEESEWPV
jgi:hypothetical protein